MPVELILLLCLVVIFVVPIFFEVNVGIVAFIVAFIERTPGDNNNRLQLVTF